MRLGPERSCKGSVCDSTPCLSLTARAPGEEPRLTREEWTQLSRQVSAAWSGDPIDADQDALYFEVLKGLSQDQVANGILGLVRDGAAARPTAGELYQASAPVLPPSSGASPRGGRLVVDVSNTPMPSAPRPVAQAVMPKPASADPASSLMSGRGMSPQAAAGSAGNGNATTGMILGIVGLIFAITAPIAIVFSALGLRDANRRPGTPGKGQAIAGLVMGVLGTVLLVWLVIMYSGT